MRLTLELFRSTPVLSQEVQQAAMGDHNDIFLWPVTQPPPRDTTPCLDGAGIGSPLVLLAVPATPHSAQIHRLSGKLLRKILQVAAGIARHIARFLELRKRQDSHLAGTDDIGKRVKGGVQGSLERRSHNEVDRGGIWERRGKILALLLAVGCQERIAHAVVLHREIVKALSVADEVHSWSLPGASQHALLRGSGNCGKDCAYHPVSITVCSVSSS